MIQNIRQLFFSNDTRTSIVKKNIMGSLVLKGISILTTLLLVPATIGYVNAELYGVWLTLASTMTWLSFADIGFTQGLKNKLTEAIAHEDWDKGKSLVSTTYFMMFLIFIPLCIILELLVPLVNWTTLLNVNSQYSEEIVKVMYVLVAFTCLQMIVNVIVSVIAAFQEVALSNSFYVLGNVLSLGIIYVLRVTIPPSLTALAFAISAMPILITITATFFLFFGRFKMVAPSLLYINRSYIKEIIGLGYKFFIINIQVLVLYQSTNVLIAYVSTPTNVTNYNIAYKLLNCAMMVYTIITAPLWPAYTDAYAKGDYEWMSKMWKKMKRILLLSIALCSLLVLFSKPLYNIWVGDNVSVPFTMTGIVFIYVVVFFFFTLNGTLIVGIGKIKLDTCVVAIGMLVHIPLALMLSSQIGAYGVILSMIVINIVYGSVYHIQVKKILSQTAHGIWNQ